MAEPVKLTQAEREALAGIIRWHVRCHVEHPDQSYLSLCITNVEGCVEGIVAARVAARVVDALRDPDRRDDMAAAWGDSAAWFTTGAKVADVVTDWLNAEADDQEGTDGRG